MYNDYGYVAAIHEYFTAAASILMVNYYDIQITIL